jgi:MscS family membrane protein
MRTPDIVRPRARAPIRRAAGVLLATLLCLSAARMVPAETADELHPDTPRGAMLGFLVAARAGDWALAASHLDLRALPEADRAARGPRLARRLKSVLDRTLWVDVDDLSTKPEGTLDDGLPPDRERVGTIDSRRGPVDVLLRRIDLPDGTHRWEVSATTVARIPQLNEEFGRGLLTEFLPAPFVDIRFFEVELWQWIGLCLLVPLAIGVSWIVAALASRSLRTFARAAGLDAKVAAAVVGPVRAIAALLLFSAGAYVLALSVPIQAMLNGVIKVLTIVAFAWLAVRLVDVLARAVEHRFLSRGQPVAVSVVPLGRRSLKTFVLVLGVIALLQNFGFNVTGLLTGLGIGGLAVALAAQKTVENLFGGVTLIADQPVRVGDFCRFGDRIGTVEEVGLRSTRVRTLDRTVVTIPNAEFSSLQLENFARRDRIWLQATIGLRYETTPDQLRHVLVDLKRLLLAHPKIYPDPARVRLVGFGAYSIDLEIFAYVRTTDINEFLAVREDLYLRIMDVIAASGTGFAFPSQTIYAAADVGLDRDRAQAAESRVRQWRAEHNLCLPDVPPEMAASLSGTLDYPADGSATPA